MWTLGKLLDLLQSAEVEKREDTCWFAFIRDIVACSNSAMSDYGNMSLAVFCWVRRACCGFSSTSIGDHKVKWMGCWVFKPFLWAVTERFGQVWPAIRLDVMKWKEWKSYISVWRGCQKRQYQECCFSTLVMIGVAYYWVSSNICRPSFNLTLSVSVRYLFVRLRA